MLMIASEGAQSYKLTAGFLKQALPPVSSQQWINSSHDTDVASSNQTVLKKTQVSACVAM